VHRAAVVADEKVAALQDRGHLLDRLALGRKDRTGADPSRHRVEGGAISFPSEKKHFRAVSSGQLRGDGGEPLGMPRSGRLRGARMKRNAQDRTVAAGGAQEAACRVPRRLIEVEAQPPVGCVAPQSAGDAKEVLDVMAFARHVERVGEEPSTPVRPEPNPARNTGETGKQRGLERLLEEDRQIEPLPFELPDQAQASPQAAVRSRPGVFQQPVAIGTSPEGIQDPGLGEQGNFGVRKALPESAHRRRNHHDVTDPVVHPDQNLADRRDGGRSHLPGISRDETKRRDRASTMADRTRSTDRRRTADASPRLGKDVEQVSQAGART
jgi:hypothetical protein